MSENNKKIVVVCGYPKSGTTWSTRLVAQLLSCPSVGFWGFEGDTFVTEGQDRDSPLICYQSHHAHHELTEVSDLPVHRLIYVVRDPRDVVVSGAFHFSFFNPLMLKFLKLIRPFSLQNNLKKLVARSNSKRYNIRRMIAMLRKGDPLIDHSNWAWDTHLDAYLKAENALVVRYEDLLLDGVNTARRILEHCEVSKTDDVIRKDLEAQSFRKRHQDFKQQNDKIKVRHMRKGVVGDWQNHLTNEEEAEIRSLFESQMKTLRYLDA